MVKTKDLFKEASFAYNNYICIYSHISNTFRSMLFTEMFECLLNDPRALTNSELLLMWGILFKDW